jgi:gliding motility-associated-like protein
LKAQFATPVNGCAPYNAVFTNTSLGGIGFKWIWGDGKTDSTSNLDPVTIIHSYPNINQYTVRLIATDTSTCNKTDTSAAWTIDVKGKPVAAFSATPQPPLANTPIVFTNNSAGAVSYKWFFGDGDSLIVNNSLPVNHIYNYTGTFTVTLIAINNAGCADTLKQAVDAKVSPVFDVPNAFVPNCGCVNNKIYVKGYGISTIKWNIYNRWGTLVFTTTNKSTGWDGKYNGILQAQDVYHYVLEIQLTNGANYIKEGDITLLR